LWKSYSEATAPVSAASVGGSQYRGRVMDLVPSHRLSPVATTPGRRHLHPHPHVDVDVVQRDSGSRQPGKTDD
jgi:hypothetical protein